VGEGRGDGDPSAIEQREGIIISTKKGQTKNKIRRKQAAVVVEEKRRRVEVSFFLETFFSNSPR